MGFYGNITNTVKTNLQFDKKYCNRFELEGKCAGDGVVSGRYVLIEYDLSWNSDGSTNDTFEIIYTRIVDGVEQFSSAPDFSIAVTPWPDIIYRAVEVQQLSPLLSVYTNKYYIGILNDENQYDTIMEKQKTALANLADLKNRFTVGLISEAAYNAQKTEIYTNHNNELRDAGGTYLKLASNSESNYVTNFNIDTNYYGDGRGWDSTVWMKSYDTQGTPKYVMVAELNSIVPTFAISVDAPTEIPQSPHFDATNTNIFYTMHLQPQWGFQVKAAEGNSDSSENRTFYTYDTENNVISSNQQNQPLNIFYNKEGFNSNKKHYISNATDKISWEATGKSGKYYNNPNHEPGAPVVGNQVDMYEFSMLLPSLGNAVSEMWDQVYDVGEGNARKQDTAWKDALVNLANEKNMSTSHETLAGTINIAHKLLGMIITTTDDNEVNYNNNYIYYNETNDKYYRINKKPVMEKVAPEDINVDNTYYVQVSNDYYQVANPNIEGFDYYEIKSYEYIKTELPAFANNMSTVNGVLLKMAQLLGLNDVHTVDTNTVQGCINHLNAIINIFSDLRPTEFAIVNEEGKIVSADWTTAQDITYTNGHDNAATALDSNDKNYWIQMDLNPTDRRLTITHALALDHKVEGNDAIKTDFDSGEVSKETFELYTPIVDNAGHIIGKNKETITLPKGLRSFTTNGIDDSATDLGAAADQNYKYTATNIKDEFAINVGNKWIESKIDGDTLTMAHSLYTIVTTDATSTDLNGSASGQDTGVLVLRDINQDLAGHITENKKHSYTLPYSYKYLTTNGSSSSANTDLSSTNTDDNSTILPTATSTKAKKGSDTLTFNTANKWIQTKISEGNDGTNSIIEIAHAKQTPEHIVPAEDSTFSNTNNTFTVTNVEWDDAAHIQKATTTTYALGNNFSALSFQNDSENTSTSITPKYAYDNLAIGLDHWIKFNSSGYSLSISHNTPKSSNATEVNTHDDEGLKFAGTFSVPSFSYDTTGHIVSATTHTLTLPTLSRNDTGTGNVLIASAIDTTDNGKINFTKEYIGKLSLDEYEHNDTDVYSTLLATDTLNSALNKLESGYLSNKAAIDLINGEGDTSSLTDLTTQVNANKAAIEVINGEEAGSIAAAITAATAAIRGTDTENTIESLNANKLDNTTYTITGSDGTTVEGTIVEILGELYNKIIELSSGSGEETT